MMAQDPESLEEMLVALERPLRVLGGLSATPVPDQVKDLRRAGRFAPPHLPYFPTSPRQERAYPNPDRNRNLNPNPNP